MIFNNNNNDKCKIFTQKGTMLYIKFSPKNSSPKISPPPPIINILSKEAPMLCVNFLPRKAPHIKP